MCFQVKRVQVNVIVLVKTSANARNAFLYIIRLHINRVSVNLVSNTSFINQCLINKMYSPISHAIPDNKTSNNF